MKLQELSIDENERIYLDGVEIPNVKEYILKGSAEKETEMTLTIDVITNKIHCRENEESSITKLKTIEIDTEKCICRINGKDIDEYIRHLKIEYADGEWEVEMTSDKFWGK
ncbi:MAG: hypothetical protein HFE57_05560 [Firmicutes bacterium]|jgi:hypothetical protein|nr:hypothetical protein [Bacillota bacterium]